MYTKNPKHSIPPNEGYSSGCFFSLAPILWFPGSECFFMEDIIFMVQLMDDVNYCREVSKQLACTQPKFCMQALNPEQKCWWLFHRHSNFLNCCAYAVIFKLMGGPAAVTFEVIEIYCRQTHIQHCSSVSYWQHRGKFSSHTQQSGYTNINTTIW